MIVLICLDISSIVFNAVAFVILIGGDDEASIVPLRSGMSKNQI